MYTPTILLSLIAAAAAFPQGYADASYSAINPWVEAGPSDSRGPCPMLNTLANHGYLGRDVTVQNIADAVSAGLNFAPSFGSALGAQAFALLGLETIDLEDLNAHNVTEHRASLTRDDYRAPGDDSIHVDLGRLRALLADSSTDYLDVASLGRSRVRVEALSGPPALAGTPLTQSLGEAALLLLAMADGPVPAAPSSSANASGVYDDLQAPKDRVAAWFAEEKLPTVLGWQTPSRELGLADIQGVSAAVAVAQQALLSSL